jgi:AcrR family transcriptional regulator
MATTRISSEERRETVVDAAVKEFAAHGYHAASTSSIAKRAGISQPYIYALFPNKRELFLACHRQVVGRIRDTFTEAARGAASPEDAIVRLGGAYMELLENRDEILMQMQAHSAAGDPELRDEIRKVFTDLFDYVREITGASHDQVIQLFAAGMYLNVIAALELPHDYCPQLG